jgi:hypothetical protein
MAIRIPTGIWPRRYSAIALLSAPYYQMGHDPAIMASSG